MNLSKFIVCGFFFITAFSAWGKPASAEKPNIIFILADDMGIDSVSANNEAMGPLKTPHIDRLISQGMNFTCLLYTSPSPRDRQKSRMPSSA